MHRAIKIQLAEHSKCIESSTIALRCLTLRASQANPAIMQCALTKKEKVAVAVTAVVVVETTSSR